MRRSEDDKNSSSVSGLPSLFQLADPAEISTETNVAAAPPGQPVPQQFQEKSEVLRAAPAHPTAVDVLPAGASHRNVVADLVDRVRRRWGVRC